MRYIIGLRFNNHIPPEGFLYDPPRFIQNYSQTAFAKQLKHLVSTLQTHFEKIQVNEITASYDDIITKNGDTNFSQILVVVEKIKYLYNLIYARCSILSEQDVHLNLSQNVICKIVIRYKEKLVFFKI